MKVLDRAAEGTNVAGTDVAGVNAADTAVACTDAGRSHVGLTDAAGIEAARTDATRTAASATEHRRGVLASACAFAAAALWPVAGRAQARFPARPVRLVVPFPAGTSPDVMARAFGERFARSIGQAVVVENRPGAGTIIGTQAVMAAAADGHTLLWTVNNTFSINPYVYRKLPYTLDDFEPVTRILSVPLVLIVSAASPVRTLDDLVREAKARPGGLSYASAGIGTSLHVVMARLLNTLGVTMTHVPYKDAFQPDLIAQRIDVAFDAITTVIAQVKGGRVRALGIGSAARVDALPDVAPIAEAYPGFGGESWHGVFAPRGTPEPVIATLAEHAQHTVDEPGFRTLLASYGLLPVGGSPAVFRRFLADDARVWAQVVQSNQISVE